MFFFFFQAEDGIRDDLVTGVQTCALPISIPRSSRCSRKRRRKSRASAREAQRLALDRFQTTAPSCSSREAALRGGLVKPPRSTFNHINRGLATSTEE